MRRAGHLLKGDLSSWGWHTVLAGILVSFALFLYGTFAWIGAYGRPPMWALVASFVLRCGSLLWFGYFNRRRVMFGASRRWRWVEYLAPVVVGPDRYVVVAASASFKSGP